MHEVGPISKGLLKVTIVWSLASNNNLCVKVEHPQQIPITLKDAQFKGPRGLARPTSSASPSIDLRTLS